MSRPQGSYGPPTFVTGRPQNGRPTDIAVATSPPSTTDAQVSAATTASGGMLVSATEVANAAAFQYPLGLLTINNIDSVAVDYQSPWSSATLSVSCSGDGVGGSKSFDISLPSANGEYILSPIEKEITVDEYPISCYLILRDNESIAGFVVGGTIDITSTAGVASTYGVATTRAADPSRTSAAAAGVATDTQDAEPSVSATTTGMSGSATNDPNPSASAATTDVASTSTSSDEQGSRGTSAGAKAGIAIGVLLAVGLILFAVWFFYRQRRRMRGMESELQETKRQHENDRAYVDGILKVAGKPDTRNGGRVVMAETPNRGSGEWKAFFKAKAAGGTPLPPSGLATANAADGRSTPGGDATSTTGLVRH
ncbi:uncharacterized protein AB675_1504 [Cyphellophora attinorum]|uniref:Uncharacterized protein n=1 Tax=Cyphellophora attinorum TaxID=1664694 RepID=A0A0N1NYJ5_9EURO|nr:uncharacterized protein AB675_1504 [Phialophora attinorum]KPI37267.1 hypothetical protein AB675_1504 [Phialophora attinorum]